MATSITGAELLVKCLINEGVTRVFGIPGGHLTGFIDAIVRLGRPQGMDFFLTRHEAAAANMADGWFRVSGEIAVCTGTVGPGASNMVAGVETAMTDNIPLLAITAQIHSDRSYPFKGSQLQLDHLTLYRPVTKWNALVNRWDRIPALVSQAFREARAGRPGPVHLDIPVDILFETGDEEAEIAPSERLNRGGTVQGDPSLIAEAAAMLAGAERPLLHAGAGVLAGGAWEELRALAEYLHCPVTTTPTARGAISETHPLCMPLAGGGMITAHMTADLVLAIGCTFSELDFWGEAPYWGAPQDQKVIQVDIDPRFLGMNRPADIAIAGDAKAVLGQLVEASAAAVPGRGEREFITICREAQKASAEAVEAAAASDASPIHPLRLMREVRDFFQEDAILAVDGGNVALWATMATLVYRPRSFLWAGGSGHLGVGLPLALGAKMAAPDRPVYILHGDGSFLFTAGELETAARLELPVIDIICNDRSFGMIKAAQNTIFEGRCCGVDFVDVRFDGIAESMGCMGIRVTEPDGIRPALEEALASGRPTVLDVIVDPAVSMQPPLLDTFAAVMLKGCEGC